MKVRIVCALLVSLVGVACAASPTPAPSPPERPTGPGDEPATTEPGTPGGESGACNRDQVCAQVLTCLNGQQYPTACGPSNCDEPIGPCSE
ncbi:MAG: hypothetical protein HS104_29085 [Polyangiaceae bacterium]|nr:hypothetical protein [Polyangiaceae bacterium]MCL4755974.1 hypothetical protein [Myxococcales bacterium]